MIPQTFFVNKKIPEYIYGPQAADRCNTQELNHACAARVDTQPLYH